MKTYRDYTELSDKIHAPEELKARVLQASLRQARPRRKPGCYGRGWSVARKAAVAAILAVTIPVAAYAAARGLGLVEYLGQIGMQDTQALDDLAVPLETNAPEATGDTQPRADYTDRFAAYSLEEVILDSGTIYASAKITPLDGDQYVLIPGIAFSDDILTVDGTAVGTPEEYAAAQGKQILYADVRFGFEDNIINGGGYDYKLCADGSIYFYFGGSNPSDRKDFAMQVSCISYTEEMSFEEFERGEFTVNVADQSTTTKQVYTGFDSAIFADTGIQMHTLILEQTELGLYATFSFSDDDAKFEDISFAIVDGSGQELAGLPIVGGSGMEKTDGGWTTTVAYQMPASLEGLQFMIRDYVGDVNYGPYAFSE